MPFIAILLCVFSCMHAMAGSHRAASTRIGSRADATEGGNASRGFKVKAEGAGDGYVICSENGKFAAIRAKDSVLVIDLEKRTTRELGAKALDESRKVSDISDDGKFGRLSDGSFVELTGK